MWPNVTLPIESIERELYVGNFSRFGWGMKHSMTENPPPVLPINTPLNFLVLLLSPVSLADLISFPFLFSSAFRGPFPSDRTRSPSQISAMNPEQCVYPNSIHPLFRRFGTFFISRASILMLYVAIVAAICFRLRIYQSSKFDGVKSRSLRKIVV